MRLSSRPNEGIPKPHLSRLGRDEAEGDRLVALREVRERLESARALVIVLEEEHVDGEIAQEYLRDRLVAPRAEEAASEVASARLRMVSAELRRRRDGNYGPAQMNGGSHARRLVP